MAEDVSYWICSCGKSNLKSTKKCSACQKHRPRRWLLYVSLAVATIVGVAILSPSSPPSQNSRSGISDPQKDFLGLIETAQKNSSAVPNSLAFQELLNSRDIELIRVASVDNWSGTVLGIHRVQGKGAISIDIGGAYVLAGVHLAYGLDTLIPPEQSTIYNELLTLRRGDEVHFSGRFSNYNGSIVEMSYTGSGAISTPELLFEFSALSHD